MAGADGARLAATQLKTAVYRQLEQLNFAPQDCRILVRIYANLARISKACNIAGLCGSEARALAPFMADLVTAPASLDFVDVGTTAGASVTKIQEAFNIFALSLIHI